MCFAGELPDHFVLIPDETFITVLQGGTLQIICEAEGVSVSKLQWLKKILPSSVEQSVPDSMVKNVVDNANNFVKAILTITNTQPQDTGHYSCILTAYGRKAIKLTIIRIKGKFVTSHRD